MTKFGIYSVGRFFLSESEKIGAEVSGVASELLFTRRDVLQLSLWPELRQACAHQELK